MAALFLLSGCVETKNGLPTGEGWVYQYLVHPMSTLITFFADKQGWGYGMGIILTTVIVRLIIFPMGIYQAWKASYQSVRREHLKPILDPYQEASKKAKEAGDQQEAMRLQQEMLAVQKENGVSMLGGIGCLPLLLQMPFFTAIFYAARYTEGVKDYIFLGINLGKPSIPLGLIIAALYYIQTYISTHAMDPMQREQMKSTLYAMPLVMIIMSFTAPAGVSLYWLVGGLVQIVQQLIVNFLIRPHHRKIVAEEFRNNPPKARPINSSFFKDVTSEPNKKSQPSASKKGKKRRNAGKQRSR